MDRKLDVRKIYESVKERSRLSRRRLWSWAPAWATWGTWWRNPIAVPYTAIPPL